MDIIDIINTKLEKQGIKKAWLASKVAIANNKLSRSLKRKRRFQPFEILRICEILNIDTK